MPPDQLIFIAAAIFFFAGMGWAIRADFKERPPDPPDGD
jgi:hypothetical protein